MTGLPHTLSDSRLASITDHLPSVGDGSGRNRLLAVCSLTLTLVSAAGSIVASGLVSEQMRIHWSLGMGPYYGPEFAPAAVVLGLFPALIGGLSVGAYWVDTRLQQVEGFAALRPYYILAVMGTLTVLVVAQGLVIAANL